MHTIPFYGKFIKPTVKRKWFAAHFRYNWMEPLFTNPYCIFLLFFVGGVNLEDVFIHFISIAIGHLNHATIGWDYGLLKYI
jgi:hypothetical protein